MQALAFRNTEFEVIGRNNQPWLRGLQIGGALEYAKPDHAIWKLYETHADEFTDKMTAVVELPTKGGIQQVRIFSLRGAHLLAMLSRTAVAKEFRRWVLDILEGVTEASNEPRYSPTLLGTTIGTDGFRCLGAVLDGKLNKLPAKAKQRAKMHIWSQVHKAFSVVSAQDIPAEQMDSARNFIAAYTLEGELVEGGHPTITPPCHTLTDSQMYEVYVTAFHFARLHRIFRESRLYDHLTGLGSRIGIDMVDHFTGGGAMAAGLLRQHAAEFEDVQRRLRVNAYR